MTRNREIINSLCFYVAQCHREQNALQVQGDSMHAQYREKEEASQRRVTRDVGGISACG